MEYSECFIKVKLGTFLKVLYSDDDDGDDDYDDDDNDSNNDNSCTITNPWKSIPETNQSYKHTFKWPPQTINNPPKITNT